MAAPPPYHALPISWDMLETHLDESCFLWGQWRRSLVAPDHVLEEVAELEGRLLAHVDALVLAGPQVASRLLVPVLCQDDEPGRVECAALALLLQEDAPEVALRSVLQAFLEGESGPRDGIRRALRLAGGTSLKTQLRTMLESARSPPVLAAILDVLGAWHVDIGPGLTTLLTHESSEVRAAAFRCVNAFPARMPDKALELGLRSALVEVGEAALEAGLIGGNRLAWLECRRQVAERGPLCGMAMRALAIAGGASHQRLLFEALENPPTRRDALRAFGLLGTVDAARICLALMREQPWAPLAAEAFSMITGRVMESTAGSREADDEDPEEPSTQYNPEEDLPLPEVSAVEAWWTEQARRFEPTARYVHGQPIGQEALLDALKDGSMYRRRALAPVLELRTRGELRITMDTWTRVQRAQMEAARRLPATRFSRSLEGGAYG
ncbi:TIGR02270 family protein [Cystobacter ferrugineus]|uniref:TIGR02270 family protein n=1 Tax=Cystobacter ferrugineus TaxID=83449 RepID=A0A1L9B695_9BACT|nr:TIGR02270 family protein [Cystobacter ferrugineus]OJH37740.1 hypothetical protein BON30_26500 [Cystobacter ferrugineus]